MPIMSRTGLVPAWGTCCSRGATNIDRRNRTPHTIVLSPVLAPALMPAADSGDINIGGPLRAPDSMVSTPDMI